MILALSCRDAPGRPSVRDILQLNNSDTEPLMQEFRGIDWFAGVVFIMTRSVPECLALLSQVS